VWDRWSRRQSEAFPESKTVGNLAGQMRSGEVQLAGAGFKAIFGKNDAGGTEAVVSITSQPASRNET